MSSLKELQSSSYLYGSNAAYVEELYELYLQDSSLVSDFWREYFDGLQNQPAVDGKESTRDQAHGPIIRSFAERAKTNGFVGRGGAQDLSIAPKQVSVQSLIAAYRSLGVRLATLDQLERSERQQLPELDPAFYGLTEADLDQLYSSTNTYFDDRDTLTLRDLLLALRDAYIHTID